MSVLRKRAPNHLIPIHRDNSTTKDWAILLEAGTIVGPSPQRIRVAHATQDKKIKRRYDILLRAKYFILVEGYNSRIHTLYFCPQLYRLAGEDYSPHALTCDDASNIHAMRPIQSL